MKTEKPSTKEQSSSGKNSSVGKKYSMDEKPLTDKRTFSEELQIFIRGFKICFEICPQSVIFNTVTAIAKQASPYFSLYMSALLVNELAGQCDLHRLLFLAAVTVIGLFAISILTRLLDGRCNVWSDGFNRRANLYISEHQNKMQFEHLENPNVTLLREEIISIASVNGYGLAKITYIFPEIIGHIVNLVVSASLTFSMFRIIDGSGLTGFLAFINSPGSAISLIVLILLNVLLSVYIAGIHTAKLMHAWEPLAQANKYLNAYGQAWGSDVTIFNLRTIILKECRKVMIKPPYLAEVEKVRLKYSTLSMLQNAILRAAIFVITAAKAFIGTFEIGSFILYKGTVTRFVGAFIHITDYLTALRENNKYLVKLYQFLDLPDDMYHGTLAVEKRNDIDYEIEFKNVSFKYPHTDTWILRNVNMKFRIGDKLAIVGENGSGKTTFIKLLCRLYDPTEGTILLNGIDITRYRYDEYLSLFSVVFQDYQLFQFSLAANVTASFDYDPKKVTDSLEKAGFGDRLHSLNQKDKEEAENRKMIQGIETVIGRAYENDGIDLSGGEKQKIALARALYKDAPFVVLDEPTAALDPIAEAAVYESFHTIVQNKTAVFISHRLSSCRFCDDIIVFDQGQLVQRGSHNVLVAQSGKYQELWHAQAQYYDEKEINVQERSGADVSR